MFKRIAVCALVVLGSRAPAYAQTPHVEVSGFAGWTFSDGVSADNAVVAGDGNIYDRVIYGEVTDFLEFYWGTWRFAAFNIADSAISIGAGS